MKCTDDSTVAPAKEESLYTIVLRREGKAVDVRWSDRLFTLMLGALLDQGYTWPIGDVVVFKEAVTLTEDGAITQIQAGDILEQLEDKK